MPFQDFTDPQTALEWDTDTLSYNPSRPEQLDMLLTILEAEYRPGTAILDLGIGSGQIEERLFRRIPQAQVVGVDASPAMTALADERLHAEAGQYRIVHHDLRRVDSVRLPDMAYGIVISVQTLHHLTEAEMRTAYGFIQRILQPGGLLLTLDRIAVDAPGLYGCYQALWARMDRLSGSQVYAHEGKTPADHKRIEQDRGDIPLGLRLHLELLAEVGFEAACLDLATNRALIAARKA